MYRKIGESNCKLLYLIGSIVEVSRSFYKFSKIQIQAQLIRNIYSVYIVIIVENKGRNRQLLLIFIAKDLLSLSGTTSSKGRTFSYGNLSAST